MEQNSNREIWFEKFKDELRSINPDLVREGGLAGLSLANQSFAEGRKPGPIAPILPELSKKKTSRLERIMRKAGIKLGGSKNETP